MAFVPFTENDRPTMAAFNEKFAQVLAEVAEKEPTMVSGTFVGTSTSSGDTLRQPTVLELPFAPRLFIMYPETYSGTSSTADAMFLKPTICYLEEGVTRVVKYAYESGNNHSYSFLLEGTTLTITPNYWSALSSDRRYRYIAIK